MLRSIFFFILIAVAMSGLQAQSGVGSAEITVETDWDKKAPVYRLAISGSPDAVALAERAFNTHGSFKLVSNDPQYSIALQKVSDNAVALEIKGARPFSQTVQGTNFSNAVAKACDLAVQKTLGIPGYFAGKLAFVSDRTGKTEIYSSDFFFKDIRTLTADNSDSMLPHWSPDGKKIVYTGYYRTKLMDLYEINLASNSRRTFASFKGTNTGGVFSPRGDKVALLLTNTGNAEIWVGDGNGRNLKRVTKNDSVEASASWSPDGTELIFTSDALGKPQIYRMNAAGGKMTRISTNISGYCSEPSWNPVNPNLIVFTAAVGKGFQIAVYDLKTRKSEFITTGGSSSLPRWTNDGRHIVFTKSNGKSRALYIVDYLNKKQTSLHSSALGNCGEADFVYTN